MTIVISPAKTLDFGNQCLTGKHSVPDFLEESEALMTMLVKLRKTQLKSLMGISDKLVELNARRYREWSTPFTVDNSKQALLAFKGDVYTGFDFASWKAADFSFAQKALRILSGLYGVLRPLDLIQPYRLEMGTRLATKRGDNLYAFWGSRITDALNELTSSTRSKSLVNLASNEYFRAVSPEELEVEVISPVFKDFKNGKYKIISFYAKKARGLMADYIIRHQLRDPSELQKFNLAGYRYEKSGSTAQSPLFLRDEPA
ncbi:MAG: peroxide stress protein YaaA [Verrucomicrobiaceae bacterium]|nr:peroxide stress protein YaaA [Verrucomicrobiaceae bacterium]